MTTREYEFYAAEHFKKQNYKVEVTSQSNDYGVDIFATKNSEKIGVQVKMYGNSRRINRKAIMELYGAKVYFDCTSAKIVTDGVLLEDAKKVADKLNIEIIQLEPNSDFIHVEENNESYAACFYIDWNTYIKPLVGKTLFNTQNKPNKIISVTNAEIIRETENGKISKISMEIFREAYFHIKENGEITRDYINQNYVGRASSGIILILSQIPSFELITNPIRIREKN